LCRPGPGLLIALYGLLSDYGQSYLRPLCALLIAAVVGTIPFWMHFGIFRPGLAVGMSAANTLGVFGFRKDFFDPKLIESLPGVLKFLSAMQTVAGTVLLFLVGLAIRNPLRLK